MEMKIKDLIHYVKRAPLHDIKTKIQYCLGPLDIDDMHFMSLQGCDD